MQRDTHDGLTRREALKRGAVIAGGLVWATPLVQAVGMSPAYAQVASPVPKNCCEGGAKLGGLTMRYLGGNNACTGYPLPLTMLDCADALPFVGLPDDVYIVASHQADIFDNQGGVDAGQIWFEGSVSVDGTFVVDSATKPGQGGLKDDTWIYIFPLADVTEGKHLQAIHMDTKCTVPLLTGDRFGSVELVDCAPVAATSTAPTQTEELVEEAPAETETGGDLPPEAEPGGEALKEADTGSVAETTGEVPAGG